MALGRVRRSAGAAFGVLLLAGCVVAHPGAAEGEVQLPSVTNCAFDQESVSVFDRLPTGPVTEPAQASESIVLGRVVSSFMTYSTSELGTLGGLRADSDCAIEHTEVSELRRGEPFAVSVVDVSRVLRGDIVVGERILVAERGGILNAVRYRTEGITPLHELAERDVTLFLRAPDATGVRSLVDDLVSVLAVAGDGTLSRTSGPDSSAFFAAARTVDELEVILGDEPFAIGDPNLILDYLRSLMATIDLAWVPRSPSDVLPNRVIELPSGGSITWSDRVLVGRVAGIGEPIGWARRFSTEERVDVEDADWVTLPVHVERDASDPTSNGGVVFVPVDPARLDELTSSIRGLRRIVAMTTGPDLGFAFGLGIIDDAGGIRFPMFASDGLGVVDPLIPDVDALHAELARPTVRIRVGDL